MREFYAPVFVNSQSLMDVLRVTTAFLYSIKDAQARGEDANTIIYMTRDMLESVTRWEQCNVYKHRISYQDRITYADRALLILAPYVSTEDLYSTVIIRQWMVWSGP